MVKQASFFFETFQQKRTNETDLTSFNKLYNN